MKGSLAGWTVRDIHGAQRSLTASLGSSLSRNSLHENCKSFIPKNPAFRSAEVAAKLLAFRLGLSQLFLSCLSPFLRHPGRMHVGQKKGFALLPSQAAGIGINPACIFPCIRENISL